MNKLAAVLSFVSIVSAAGLPLSEANTLGMMLILDMDCSLEEALCLMAD